MEIVDFSLSKSDIDFNSNIMTTETLDLSNRKNEVPSIENVVTLTEKENILLSGETNENGMNKNQVVNFIVNEHSSKNNTDNTSKSLVEISGDLDIQNSTEPETEELENFKSNNLSKIDEDFAISSSSDIEYSTINIESNEIALDGNAYQVPNNSLVEYDKPSVIAESEENENIIGLIPAWKVLTFIMIRLIVLETQVILLFKAYSLS